MTPDQFLNKLAYPALYRRDADDVVRHLSDMIAAGINGYDEGIDYYAERLAGLLADDQVLQEILTMMTVQTRFTDREWREILKKLAESLKRHRGA